MDIKQLLYESVLFILSICRYTPVKLKWKLVAVISILITPNTKVILIITLF